MISNRKARRRSNALLRKSNKKRTGKIAAALIGSAAGVLTGAIPTPSVAQVFPGPPQCSISGTTVTCSGDLRGGVSVYGAYDTLNVNNVDAPGITPSYDGIVLQSNTNQDLTINADTTGTAGIELTGGSGGHGILAAKNNGSGNISVNSIGNITTRRSQSQGIYAFRVWHKITASIFCDCQFWQNPGSG